MANPGMKGGNTQPVFDAHAGEPAPMVPTRGPNGIRWIPANLSPPRQQVVARVNPDNTITWVRE
jgi:hypothetical protein